MPQLRGIDAITGGSNFDIAEYIWIKLIIELAPQRPTIALLCKTSVARNVLHYAFEARLPIMAATIRKIDSMKWFDAAAAGCLFPVRLGPGEPTYEASVYPNLTTRRAEGIIGVVGGRLVSDATAYKRVAFADGHCPLTWRQGLKHDAASVMELSFDAAGKVQNNLGQSVSVEEEYLYPLVKSTDLFHARHAEPTRTVIVPQRHLSDDTERLRTTAPNLWKYLTSHSKIFKQRRSSIYLNRPPFAIFGIGSYSFSPYKVAVSGLHKTPLFRALGPVRRRPVMLDDTCYFIACHSPTQAALLAALLNHPTTLDLLRSMSFQDSKRPFAKKVLQRIDLKSLLDHVDQGSLLAAANLERRRLTPTASQGNESWPSSLERLLTDQPQLALTDL